MSALDDARAWLDTPAGLAYQSAHGGYRQALAALVADDDSRHRAAYELNRAREAQGLRALSGAEALAAVSLPAGVTVSGDSADVAAALSHDPSWRVRVADEPAPDPMPAPWAGRVG